MTIKNFTAKTDGKQPSVKIGDVFRTNQGYDVVVVSYGGYRDITIEFKDDRKHRSVVVSQNLKKGQVKNPYHPSVVGIGYIGVGKHPVSVNRKLTHAYITWTNMIKRCYCPKSLAKRPSYKDCSVDTRWHDFQNFAEWHVGQAYYDTGYHLDKDLLVKGNRVYAPETCLLIPNDINGLLIENISCRGSLPIGVHYHKGKGCYTAQLSLGGGNIMHLGGFQTVDKASDAYVEAKERHVKNKALEWRGRIDDRAFNALMAWTVY